MAHAEFVIYKDQGEKYRCRLVAPNGDRRLGPALRLSYDAKRAAEEVKAHAAAAEIVEE